MILRLPKVDYTRDERVCKAARQTLAAFAVQRDREPLALLTREPKKNVCKLLCADHSNDR